MAAQRGNSAQPCPAKGRTPGTGRGAWARTGGTGVMPRGGCAESTGGWAGETPGTPPGAEFNTGGTPGYVELGRDKPLLLGRRTKKSSPPSGSPLSFEFPLLLLLLFEFLFEFLLLFESLLRLLSPSGVVGVLVAVGVPGVPVAVGVPGVLVAVGVPGVPVAVGVPGVLVAVGVPGVLVAVGVPGVLVAVGVPGVLVGVDVVTVPVAVAVGVAVVSVTVTVWPGGVVVTVGPVDTWAYAVGTPSARSSGRTYPLAATTPTAAVAEPAKRRRLTLFPVAVISARSCAFAPARTDMDGTTAPA